MNGKSHNSGAYKSPRPAPTGKPIVRLSGRRGSALAHFNCSDASELLHFISAVMQMGCNVSFTLTSDGGAISITCLDGDVRYKGWAHREDELYERYADLLSALRGEE